jgi:transposase, IS5 family
MGFGDPREVDFDSTVQEANISYPSDANIMSKLAVRGKAFIDYVKEKVKSLPVNFGVDIKSIKNTARKYFFLAKNKSMEIKREIFKELHCLVKQQLRPVVDLCNSLNKKEIKKLPWNIQRIFYQLTEDCWRYLLDVGHFTRTHTLKAGKILSFHAKELACIKKGKIGKEFQFGRVFQLGRIKGNQSP